MLRRFMLAFACLVLTTGIAPQASATRFGFGFLIDLGNGDAALGLGKLFATDNLDGSFTVTGASAATSFYDLQSGETYGDDTIIGAETSPYADEGASATIMLGANGLYSIRDLRLVGKERDFDFVYLGGDRLLGFTGEVGGEAQFELGLDEASPAPEAATWAMMLLGFGALGSSLRSRRRALSFG